MRSFTDFFLWSPYIILTILTIEFNFAYPECSPNSQFPVTDENYNGGEGLEVRPQYGGLDGIDNSSF